MQSKIALALGLSVAMATMGAGCSGGDAEAPQSDQPVATTGVGSVASATAPSAAGGVASQPVTNPNAIEVSPETKSEQIQMNPAKNKK